MTTIYVRPDQLQTGVTTLTSLDNTDTFTKLYAALRNNTSGCAVYAVTADGTPAHRYNTRFKTLLLNTLDQHGCDEIRELVINDQENGTPWSYYRYEFTFESKVIYNAEAFGLPHDSCMWIVIGEQERVDYDAHAKAYVLSGCKRFIVIPANML